MSDYDVPDGGGVLHRLMSKMSVRHKKEETAADFTYVSHRESERRQPNRTQSHHVRQSSNPESRRMNNNRPRVNLNKSEIKFSDIYTKPLSPDDEQTKSATYIRDIPPQAPNSQPRTPFYTPPGTVEKNSNNNNLDAPPQPPPRTMGISHRRTKSNPSDRKIAPLKIAPRESNLKYDTMPSPLSPTTDPTFDPLNTPITPGINENPLAFRLRANEEKSRSLQNQPSRMEVSADQDLEFLMYGRNAVKYNSEFKHSQELDRSRAATDWEGLEKIKRNLKQDHQEITQRLSKRFSRSDVDQVIPNYPGGLSDEEHLYFKPNFTRDDALKHLTGEREGSFVLRQSRRSNSYAISLSTQEQGVQHILVQQEHHMWQISSGTASLIELPSFSTVPELVLHYQKHKLPIKGCQRDVFLR